MPVTFARVKCETEAEKLGLKSGVSILNATAMTAVPVVPPHLKEPAAAFLLVAGDVGDMGQPLESGMRWIRSPELDLDGEGGWFCLTGVVAFRLAHVGPGELVYSIRKE